MSYLCLKNISKGWGEKLALNDISFEVEEGAFVALLGPSGCGKSTLLRTLAGLEVADKGAIYFQQQEVTHFSPSQRKLSMVFQSYALFPHLSVRENLLFGLKARGEDKRLFKRRLEDVAQLMELDTLLDRLPAQLSGGQQQRVALGRAVIANNTLCLMDEPLSNLDAKLRQSMRREIRALQKKLGLTLIYVTHDQTEAMSMADKIILLNDGRIEQQGTPDNLYNHPATVFSAQFIGAPPMSILPLARKGSSHFLGDLATPVIAHYQASTLSLGLRAEDIQLCAPENAALNADVVSVEFMGSDTLVVCRIAQSQATLMVKVSGMRSFAEGCVVGLRWETTAQYFFASATGKRCYPDVEKVLAINEKCAG